MTLERRLTWVALAATSVLLVVLVGSAPAVIRAMESNADYVSPLVMGHDAHLYPDSRIVLGNYGWWPGIWAVQLLRPLPAGEHLAAALPMGITLAVIALVAAQALRAFGRSAAVLVLAVSLAACVSVWVAAASWSVHFTAWWAMGIAGVTAVAWARGPSRWAVAGAVATVLWGGLVLSGDRLAYAAVIAPLLAAALALGVRRAWRPAAALAATAVATVAAGAGVRALAHALNYYEHVFDIQTVPYGLLGNQAASVFVVFQQLWAGNPARFVGASTSYLGAAIAIAALAALPGLLHRNATRGGTVPPPNRGESVRTGEEGLPSEARSGTVPLVWSAFWGTAILACCGAFMISQASVIGGEVVPRYLYGLPLAFGALLAVAPKRPLALAAAAALALGTSVNFLTDPPVREPREHGPALANILAAAREHDVTRGYASYWTAYPLERASRFALRLSPVGACGGGPGLCPMYLHRLDGAFVPRPGRTFLLFDASAYALPDDRDWVTREPLGAEPVERVDVGDGLTMLIYDHDIAENLGPVPGLAE